MNRRKIFLLTPDQREVDNLTPALDEIGYDWRHYRHVDEMLHDLEREHPDLLIANALTPRTDMGQLCTQVHELSQAKILLTSAISSSTYRLQARHRWDIDEFVTLPVPLKKMVRLIAFMMGDIDEKPIIRSGNEAASTRPSATKEETDIRTTTTKLPLEGDLREVPIGRLLGIAVLRQLSGRLVVGDTAECRELVLLNGRLLDLRSPFVESLALGEMLAAHKLVDAALIDDLVAEASASGKRLGELLRARKLVTTQQLMETLDRQVIEKLATVFHWRDAPYRFAREDNPSDVIEPRNLLLAKVAFRAARRSAESMDFEERFAKWLDQRVKLNASSPIRGNMLDLDSNEKRFLVGLKNPRLIRDIISETSLPLRQAQSFLAALLLLRMVRRIG